MSIDIGGKKELLRIDEMYAFVAQDADGEGLTGFQMGDTFMPMVAADKTRVDQLRSIAQQIARDTGQTVKLVRFSVREELETFKP